MPFKPNWNGTDSERFWRQVDVQGWDECWPWLGCKVISSRKSRWGSLPYGRFNVNGGRHIYAHVWAYNRIKAPIFGKIPEGYELHHVCENPSCVNPFHLECKEKLEHFYIGNTPAAENARKTHCKHGHPLSGDNLYIRPDGDRSCRKCKCASVTAYRKRKALAR